MAAHTDAGSLDSRSHVRPRVLQVGFWFWFGPAGTSALHVKGDYREPPPDPTPHMRLVEHARTLFLRGAVAPAAVGVDIGCGMAAVRTSLTARDLPDSLARLRTQIENSIPVGRGLHREAVWDEASSALRSAGRALMDQFSALTSAVHRLEARAGAQLGTLGGGNHFIEVCLDTGGAVWLILHSGSRNVGAALAEYHMERAQRLFHNQALPDPDLAVFLAGTPQFDAYRRDFVLGAAVRGLDGGADARS